VGTCKALITFRCQLLGIAPPIPVTYRLVGNGFPEIWRSPSCGKLTYEETCRQAQLATPVGVTRVTVHDCRPVMYGHAVAATLYLLDRIFVWMGIYSHCLPFTKFELLRLNMLKVGIPFRLAPPFFWARPPFRGPIRCSLE
jgi:hypothetical protein